jgi:hypothetical protein
VARWTYNDTGLFIARFRVTDNDGATAQDVLRVQVSSSTTQNQPPAAEAGGPYEGVSGTQVTLTGTGSDIDGRVVSYEWDFEGDGTIDHFSPASGTTTKVYQSSGTFNAVLYVTDDDGAVATDSAVVTISRANAPPTVQVGSPSPNAAIKGYYVVRGTSADDLGVFKVEIRIDEGSWVAATGTLVWSYDLDSSTLVPGVHTLRARAIDTNGEASRTVEVPFTVDDAEVEEEEQDPWYMSWVLWVMVLLVVIPVAISIVVVIRNRR